MRRNVKRSPATGKEHAPSMTPQAVADRERRSFSRRLRSSGVMVSELVRLLNILPPRASAMLGGALMPSGAERARLERYFESGE
jgi:hypothetical protein